jgi:hypothetical protein
MQDTIQNVTRNSIKATQNNIERPSESHDNRHEFHSNRPKLHDNRPELHDNRHGFHSNRLNSTTTAINSTATALGTTQLHPAPSSTLLSTQPFDRTLGGPFAELFSIRLSATRTLCVSIFSFISTSLVYMGIISRNSGFVNTFGENFVGEVANFDNS